MAQLPVEIFEIITSYLTRAEVKALRLVCREFEAKVSGQYFRNVVVPFRPELYNSLGRDEHCGVRPAAASLFANGMRIFESFGPHILRFALSLELDEDALAYPPVKPVQEAVPAFWGIYRWPHETYHRYTDLEGLEQTADETEGMKEALRCLSKVSNLGLCCDAGLGFLVGPDQVARKATVRHPVFETNDWRQDQPARKGNPALADLNDVVKNAGKNAGRSSTSQPDTFKRKVLEKMVSDAGFTGLEINEAIDLMLETERTSLTTIDFDERPAPVSERNRRATSSQVRNLAGMDLEAELDAESATESNRHPLIPTNLTRAQKELLLELEWAHRAMIQSYVIGLIDNAADGCFNNLTTLTIAKIPSAHIHILSREELWKSIPSVKDVSLGVISDWRKISKSSPGCVEDTSVSPTDAVPKVFRLLNDYISKQPNIESIRFEWICGGEFALSSYQRNQYILPAPFVEFPVAMGQPDGAKKTEQLLSLPHIKHLSLKNCWVSPHVLLQTIRQLALQSLEKLELESVSLSGPPMITAQPVLHMHAFGQGAGAAAVAGAANANPINLFPVFGAAAPPFQPAILGMPSDASRSGSPDIMSWAGFIEHFSPGIKVRRQISTHGDSTGASNAGARDIIPFVPDVDRLPLDEKLYNIKYLSFKSCGYVYLDLPHLHTRWLMPPDGQNGYAYSNSHRHEIFAMMQSCKDKHFGRILPYIAPQELVYLEQTFEMDHGWDKIYDAQVYENAVADGVECPGLGRFSGVVTPDNPKPWRTIVDPPSTSG